MFVSILYEICLTLLGIVYLPFLLYFLIFKKKYRKSILKRFGSGFPNIDKNGRPLIWVHAVSLGETKAVAALTKLLKAECKDSLMIFSTTTETGQLEACKSITADYHVYLPFDFGWVIRPIVKRTKPDLVVLCESDFWYNFVDAAKSVGAKVAVVNAKLSVKSQQRFLQVPFFVRKLFGRIDLFCMQSNLYKKRFASLPIPENKFVVTGNMKFDGDYARLPSDQLKAWQSELGIEPSDLVLVIGSSHSPEETLFLKALQPVWKEFPQLKVVLVPRHPERFNEVATILQKSGVTSRRFSQKEGSDLTASVILVDAMGLLRKCYQLADVAIVAGSYTSKVGGHNILEPCWYGVPVVFGPEMHSQPDLVDLIHEYQAGIQVSMEGLSQALLRLFRDKNSRKALGDAGLCLAGDLHGATDKTFMQLKQLVENKS